METPGSSAIDDQSLHLHEEACSCLSAANQDEVSPQAQYMNLSNITGLPGTASPTPIVFMALMVATLPYSW